MRRERGAHPRTRRSPTVDRAEDTNPVTGAERALRSRDRTCRFPGCGQHRFLHAHHIQHWAQGGRTDLSNLIQLYSHHHRLVHEAGYTVERRRGGRVRFRRPDGRAVPAAPGAPQGEAVAVPRLNGTAGVTVDDTTCVPRVHSERMQLHWILDGLAEADPRLRALDAGKAGAEFPIGRSAGRNTGDAFFSVEGSVWREAPNALASGRMRQ
jgi:hypothetical protein